MSLLIAPDLVQGAAKQLAGIGSSVAETAKTMAGPTTAVAAAAEDEVSVAVASLFGNFGREFQAISAQAQAFHAQFVDLIDAGAGAYLNAEIANVQQTLLGGAVGAPATASTAAGIDPIAPWQQVFATTSQNAETVLGASRQAVNTFSTGLRQLVTNPATFLSNVQTAAQSVFLVGAPENVATAVAQHTLGGITSTIVPPPAIPELVPDVHVQLYSGLIADFLPTGPEGLLLTGAINFAASPVSGLLMGAVGPFVSPGVALLNSGGSIFADLTGGNTTAALAGLINTPAHVVNAFFNGATLNLDPLAPAVNTFISGPTGGTEQVTGLSLGFGGLFSPGQVVTGASGPMYNGVGGSLLNSLGVELTFAEEDFQGVLPVPALGIGPIAATANLFSILGHALGGTLLG